MSTKKRGRVWHYDFTIRGKRYREAIPEARTKSQADRAESAARDAIYNQRFTPSTRLITFKAFVEGVYLPIAKEHTRNFSSNVGYQSKKLVAQFGDKLITEISNFEIEKWLIEQKRIYSGATVNRLIERLNAIYSRAVAAGYVELSKNPMLPVGKVEENPRAKKRLSREEEAKILQAANELGFDQVTSAVIVLLETGMRPMEFFLMQKDQVVLSEGIVQAISYKLGRRRSATAQPKTRIIPVTERARVEFEKLIARPGKRIFPYNSIKKAWATVCKAAGIEDFWLRWLRDEAENRWREAGMHPLDIAKLMGHASPRTTMIYNNPHFETIAAQMREASLVTDRSQKEKGKVLSLACK